MQAFSLFAILGADARYPAFGGTVCGIAAALPGAEIHHFWMDAI